MIWAAGGPGWLTLVHFCGVSLAVLGIVICLRLLLVSKEKAQSKQLLSLGFVVLPTFVFYKLLAFTGLLAVPAATVGVAGYHLFDGIKETRSCMQCHVMHPMGNDMSDPDSNTLAARHFRNKWIPEQHCYACHVDYGLAGTITAKMDGFRHLARYTTGTAREPIQYKGKYNNHNCLHCHAETPKYQAIPSHRTVQEALASSDMSCTNCHGPAHPSRERRTPGHPDYARLVEKTAWD